MTVAMETAGLQECGFIVRTKPGFLGIEGKGTGATWRLTELPCRGERPTQDYKREGLENRTPSEETGQGVRINRTENGGGVRSNRTRCPKDADGNGGETGSACPQSPDDL